MSSFNITTTPRKALSTRSHRPAYGHTASTPNLAANYTSSSPNNAYDLSRARANRSHSSRKPSLSSLTQTSLSSIPDDSESYSVPYAHYTSPDQNQTVPLNMGRLSMMDGSADLAVGDLVDVPGNMHGIVRYVGNVEAKKGTFAGVELSEEFASRGKNSGDVDGTSYFVTTIPGAGIFLPRDRAIRRAQSPYTPRPSHSRVSTIQKSTPPTPDFSRSVGPARSATTGSRQMRRTSLPRPESPVRKLASATPRPSIGGTPSVQSSNSRYAPSPTPQRFSQSVRGTKDVGDPAKRSGYTPRARAPPRSASALSNVDFDDDNTPSAASRYGKKNSVSSVSSFARTNSDSRALNEQVSKLKIELEDRDRQLREQASNIVEMESSLAELQGFLAAEAGNRDSYSDQDAMQLRTALRDKNEKIAMLTAEFDTHRADFRSTIDTLEMASTETERVYEQRVEDLARELQAYQERSDDVDSVAIQLKQLEELVQELEEGLEDARRGEAEARGEVEFLRGEVERGRSELRREREKAVASQEHGEDTALLAQRDDEIRGLKAIIHSISRDGNIHSADNMPRTPTKRNGNLEPTPRSSQELRATMEKEALEKDVSELRSLVNTKTKREEELEREVEALRRITLSDRESHQNGSVYTTTSQERRPAQKSWREHERERNLAQAAPPPPPPPPATSSQPTHETQSLWCEICETSGHDILTCTNMFGSTSSSKPTTQQQRLPPRQPQQQRSHHVSNDSAQQPSTQTHAAASSKLADFNASDPVAGKASGMINLEKWCALCEQDGHESVDCPFEDIL